jgi:hypothetical protein
MSMHHSKISIQEEKHLRYQLIHLEAFGSEILK